MSEQDMNLNVQQMRTLPVHGNFTQDSELWKACHEVAACWFLPMEVRLEALSKMNELTGEDDPCDEDTLIEYLKDAV